MTQMLALCGFPASFQVIAIEIDNGSERNHVILVEPVDKLTPLDTQHPFEVSVQLFQWNAPTWFIHFAELHIIPPFSFRISRGATYGAVAKSPAFFDLLV